MPAKFLHTGYIVTIVFVIWFFSCKQKGDESSLFTKMEQSGIKFNNAVTDNKDNNSFLFRNFYNGGGVATGDINNDGLADVLLTSNMGGNKLFLNKGNFQFEDITPASGFRQDSMWSTGVVMADVNADGWLDIYICNSGHMVNGNRRNKLYINNRDLSFSDSAAAYGLDISGYCTQASFFDYDLDGDLDCFLINNSPLPFSSLNYAGMRDANIEQWGGDEKFRGGGNHLYKNNEGRFVEVTKEAGLHTGLISFGLGVSVGDINNDDYPDIYVGNDFIEKDYLYINQKNGTFKDELEDYVQQISMSSMSSDLADVNNDGLPEIFTTDMIPDDDYRLKTTGTFDNIDLYLSKEKAGLYHQYVRNCLQLNNGNNTFSNIAFYSGVSGTDWSWGALFFDADNDGLNDVFVCNGINRDLGDLDFLDYFSNDIYQQMLTTGKRAEMDEILKHIPVTPLPNRVFKNEGALQFKGVEKYWGLDEPGFSNSIAYSDLDNDGDLDLVINNENQEAFVYRNESRGQNGNNYIGFDLKGWGKNTFAIGAKIKVYRGAEVLYREVVPSRGFQSSVDYKQVIGLGEQTNIDSVIVTWPDRTYSKYTGLAVNQTHKLEQPATGALPVAVPAPSRQLLQQDSSAVFEKHAEDDHIDFYYERNIPELLSREGPALAKGDVNGDGLEDIYIGGARDQAGQLYLQTAKGGFIKQVQPVFKEYAAFEDVAAVLFDADKDGDNDLFIGAGGNNVEGYSREIQHRLYKNDGKGNFSIDVRSFSNNSMNISVAVNYDYDADGDEDLFVGSRSVPYNYGVTPASYIYQNDGQGRFTDVTDQVSPGKALSQAGMITAALWVDVTGDKQKELVITGEWMPAKIFSYNKQRKQFEQLKQTGLEQLSGWWQSLATTDINGDGKADLVIGNVGENFYLRPDAQNPVKLWLNDFDNNGTREQFLTRAINKRDMPVFLKREITDQFPSLKKENLRHAEYAKKSIQELFGKEVISRSQSREFNYCKSIIAINEGNGKFRVEPLPYQGQLSNIRAICPADVNGDGREDVLIAGNLFTFPPQFGRLDAGYGQVLLNEGGSYSWLPYNQTGMLLRGEVKSIAKLKTANNTPFFVIAQNNLKPVTVKIR